ncbi:uncharacterized protein LOC116962307 [Tyto alba]|uniref:uncharacterized protein LOC116962307 n=1 Tax=Tyto alba TaxID=56313 RepID=UPI001C685D6E|nr:uncharacterized protein LOC116962307 [Tyto alba]
MGLEEHVPGKMGSSPGLAQLEDVCCKCLCPFLLALLVPGWLCRAVQQPCALSSPWLLPLPLPWSQKCESSPGATALRHPCWLPQRGAAQPGRRPRCDAAAPFISSQLQLSLAEIFLLCAMLQKHKPESKPSAISPCGVSLPRCHTSKETRDVASFKPSTFSELVCGSTEAGVMQRYLRVRLGLQEPLEKLPQSRCDK